MIGGHLVILTFVLIIKLCAAGDTLSGLYMDNGHAQTILAKPLSIDDKIAVEQEILDLLDLPNRKIDGPPKSSLKRSAPKFLLDVYRRLRSDDDDDDGTDTIDSVDVEEVHSHRVQRDISNFDYSLSDDDERAIDESDVIITFTNKQNHVDEIRHNQGWRLWFDVTTVPDEITLTMALLRFYKKSVMNKNGSNMKYQINVYAKHRNDLELITTTNTSSNHQGWIELNVTATLARWIAVHDENEGFYITANSLENLGKSDEKLDDIGVISPKGDEEYQPFMIGYFNGVQLVSSHTISRSKRSTNTTPKKRKSVSNVNVLDDWRYESPSTCQIKTLYVSFRDLNWHDWIIAPTGFNAHYCSGQCNFPLNAPRNPTNHAIIQTLVNLVNPAKVPKPCCAPSKLGPISVLYYLDDSNVVVKKYRNIVVKSCGCH